MYCSIIQSKITVTNLNLLVKCNEIKEQTNATSLHWRCGPPVPYLALRRSNSNGENNKNFIEKLEINATKFSNVWNGKVSGMAHWLNRMPRSPTSVTGPDFTLFLIFRSKLKVFTVTVIMLCNLTWYTLAFSSKPSRLELKSQLESGVRCSICPILRLHKAESVVINWRFVMWRSSC